MAAVINASLSARVAAPKVRRGSRVARRAGALARFSGGNRMPAFRPFARNNATRLENRTLTIAPPPRASQVTARRSFLGKGVAGLAPVRYVCARIDRALERVPAAANPEVTPDRVRIVRGARPQILIRVRTPLDRSRRLAATRAINPASRR